MCASRGAWGLRAFASPRARGRRACSAALCTAAAKQDEALLDWCKGHGLYISPKLALGVDPEVNCVFPFCACTPAEERQSPVILGWVPMCEFINVYKLNPKPIYVLFMFIH